MSLGRESRVPLRDDLGTVELADTREDKRVSGDLIGKRAAEAQPIV